MLGLLLESGPQRRNKMMDQDQWHSAHVLPAEVMNVLRKLRNARTLSPTQADALLAIFWDLPIVLWPMQTTSVEAWKLSHRLSSYDAWYASLASLLQAPLITNDQKMINGLQNSSVRCLSGTQYFA